MTDFLLLAVFAVSAYLIGGVNLAIVLSKAVYHKDIRECGSKNPGFTNFKRVFGWKYGWIVMISDLVKAAAPVALAAILFRQFGGNADWFAGFDAHARWQFAAAWTGLFAMLGHAYPVYYKFEGGKAFLTGAAAVFVVDWRAGLCAMAVFLLILFTVKIMSLSSIVAAIVCPVTVGLFGGCPAVIVLSALSAAFMIWRHKPNIIRLMHGEEKKFSLFGGKKSGSA